MITLTMSLVPYGISFFGAHDLVRGRLWSSREQHRYALTLCGAGEDGDLDLAGAVPRKYSGHRNPLHLLSRVLDDCDLAALPRDAVTTPLDRPGDRAVLARDRADGLEDMIAALRALARAGDLAALDRLGGEIARLRAAAAQRPQNRDDFFAAPETEFPDRDAPPGEDPG